MLNLYISATKHDRDMQFSGMESVFSFGWRTHNYENQHEMTKLYINPTVNTHMMQSAYPHA